MEIKLYKNKKGHEWLHIDNEFPHNMESKEFLDLVNMIIETNHGVVAKNILYNTLKELVFHFGESIDEDSKVLTI